MSRFLFVVLPLAGHVNPAGAVATALAGQGHEVAWVGSRARLAPWLGDDAVVYPTGMRLYRGRSDTGMAAVKSLWQHFLVPFARFTLPAVERAIDEFGPDVVVVDQHALAGAAAAHRRGLPWATVCTSAIELARPFRTLPKVESWIDGQVAVVRAAAGLPSGDPVDLRFSPHLVITLTTAALTGQIGLPPQAAMVGPALARRPAGPPFPWGRLDERRRRVLVTLGTVADDLATQASGFYARVLAGLAPVAGQVQPIVIASPQAVPDPPDHALVVPRAPVLELMPHLHAVLCHGGMNTVCEALSHGVPVVVAPITRDQPVHAAQVAAAGAGLRVSFARSSPGRLREAVTAVLEDPAYRAGAQRVRDSFRAAGGAPEAARRLELLAQAGAGDRQSAAAAVHGKG